MYQAKDGGHRAGGPAAPCRMAAAGESTESEAA